MMQDRTEEKSERAHNQGQSTDNASENLDAPQKQTEDLKLANANLETELQEERAKTQELATKLGDHIKTILELQNELEKPLEILREEFQARMEKLEAAITGENKDVMVQLLQEQIGNLCTDADQQQVISQLQD